jgi:asparagine synthase (glutamine-hydrolysing)
MPGLAIIIGRSANHPYHEQIQQMVSVMRHESFYNAGSYSDDTLGVHIGWVCHAGSYSDCMPMRSRDGSLLVFFYGEHHNDDSSSRSDAREILRLLEARGLDALPRLNGWFHGAIIDTKNRTVAVFNDRFGMQRLHVHQTGDAAMFASEAKALLAVEPKLRQLDPAGLADFITCGCVLDNRSLFAGVRTLPAATVKIFAADGTEKTYRYFAPTEWESQPILDERAFFSTLENAFADSVRRCVNGSHSLGFSLTGGFDTRLISAWIENQRSIPCYTFGGMYRDCFDVKIAQKVAAIRGWHHEVLRLDDSFLAHFPTLAEKTISLSDGCLGATNAYELFLNQLARQVGLVRLTGSYGSEVMRGARAFKAVAASPGLIHPDFQPAIDASLERFAHTETGHPVSFSVFKQAPWYYYNRLAVEQSQVVIRTPYMDNDFVALFYRKPSTIGDPRVLARRLIASGAPRLAALPTDTGNCSFLRHQWTQFTFKADYCYKSGMPQWLERAHYLLGPLQPEKILIGRHRFAHFRVWFRRQLADYVRDTLLDSACAARSFFNWDFVEQMVRRHIKGSHNYTDEIEKILTVELTCRHFLRS